MRCCLIAVLFTALAGVILAADEPTAAGRVTVAPIPVSAYTI